MLKLNFDFNWKRSYSLTRARLKLTGIKGALIAVLLGASLAPAGAGTVVLGRLDALQLRAEHASTGEALAALAASFKLTYRLPPNVNRDLNGLYSGSLGTVLARILDGTDYYVKNFDDRVEVIVLRASSAVSAEPVPNAVGPKLAASSPPPPLTAYLTDK